MPGAPRSLIACLLALGSILPLAACGSINQGDQLAADFVAWMRDTDGVADVTAGGVNTLPWAGRATGRVTLEADLDESSMWGVLERADTFPDRNNVDIEATYAGGGFTGTFDVPREPRERGAVLDTVLTAATLPGAEAITVGPRNAVAESPDWERECVLTVKDDANGRYDIAASVLLGPETPCTTLQVATPDDAFTVTAREGEDLTGARAALAAITAIRPVTEAYLAPTSLEVRVDAPRSPDLAAAASAAAPDVVVVVQFGNVNAGDASDAVLAVADAAAQSGVPLAVHATGGVTVEVQNVADALIADAAVWALPEAAEVHVEYRTVDENFTLQATDGPLAHDAPLLNALTTPPLSHRIQAFSQRSGNLHLRANAATTVDDARALGATCEHIASGTELRVVFDLDFDSFDVEILPDGITEPDISAAGESTSYPLMRAFADACRDAR